MGFEPGGSWVRIPSGAQTFSVSSYDWFLTIIIIIVVIIIIIIIIIINFILIESAHVFIIGGCLGLKRHHYGPDMWYNIAHLVTWIYNLWVNSVLLCLLLIRAITWLSTGSTGEQSAFTHKTSSFDAGKSGTTLPWCNYIAMTQQHCHCHDVTTLRTEKVLTSSCVCASFMMKSLTR